MPLTAALPAPSTFIAPAHVMAMPIDIDGRENAFASIGTDLDVLSEIGRHVSGRDALSASHTCRSLRAVCFAQAQCFIASDLSRMSPAAQSSACEALSRAMPRMPKAALETVFTTLLAVQSRIYANEARLMVRRCAWDAWMHLPADRDDRRYHKMSMLCFPEVSRCDRLLRFIDKVAPLYTRDDMSYDRYYGANGLAKGGSPDPHEIVPTPLWKARMEIGFLPLAQRKAVLDHVRALEGMPFGPIVDSIVSTIGDTAHGLVEYGDAGTGMLFEASGFTPHEAAFLAGLPYAGSAVTFPSLVPALEWRIGEQLFSFDMLVCAHLDRRVPDA